MAWSSTASKQSTSSPTITRSCETNSLHSTKNAKCTPHEQVLLPYPEMSGQRELIRGLRISEYSRIFSHVWGPSIPSTPDYSQLLPRGIVSTLHLP